MITEYSLIWIWYNILVPSFLDTQAVANLLPSVGEKVVINEHLFV